MTGCLDENQIADYLERRAGSAAFEEVERHVDGCADCRRLLAATADTLFDDQGPGGESEAPRGVIRRGTTVGRYVIMKPVGAGGMGVVFAAYDPELDRKVALKLLRADLFRDEPTVMRARLVREAQAMARLSHPDVITVYDVGTLGEQIFVAMEFVDGGTLAEWLRAGPRGWREVLDCFVRAGRGLAAAHRAGLIHRDFKPDNVLVAQDQRVRVTDFGLARPVTSGAPPRPPELPAASDGGASLTVEGAMVGTPAYMAPEQLRGEPLDARSDLFSFCVALWEGLYGERPYRVPSVTTAHPPEAPLRVAQLVDVIERGEVSEGQATRSVPARLRRILLRGLRPRPGDRWGSMDELLAALERDPRAPIRRGLAAFAAVAAVGLAVAGVRIAARPTLLCKGAERKLAGVWDGERKTALRIAFAATGTPYAASTAGEVSRVLDLYAAAWTSAHTEACEATRLRGEQSEDLLELRMRCLDEERRELSADVALLVTADAQVVQHAVEAVSSLRPVAACANVEQLRARAPLPRDRETRRRASEIAGRLADAKALRDAGRYPGGLTAAQTALDGARPLSYPPLTAAALLLVGDLDRRLGRFPDAARLLEEAALVAGGTRDDETAAEAMALLVEVVGDRLSRPDQGLLWGRLAAATVERLQGDPRRAALLESSLGHLEYARGHYAEAADHAGRSLTLSERAVGPDHPLVAASRIDLGRALRNLGRYDDALTSCQRALAQRRRTLGADHPLVADAQFCVAEVELRLGRFDAALLDARGALSIRERALGGDSLDVAYSLNQLGNLSLARGDLDAAVAYYIRVRDLGARILGPDYAEVGMAHYNLALALLAARRLDEAEREATQAWPIVERALPPEHPYRGMVLSAQGSVRAARHDYRRALALHRRAVASLERAGGPEQQDLGEALTGVGSDLLGMGDAAAAIAPLERAVLLRRLDYNSSAQNVGETRFALSRALWAGGGDRRRAARLATEARDLFRQAGSAATAQLAEAERFVAGHPAPAAAATPR